MYISCGRGPRSTFRVLRHGLEVSEMAVSELPGNPNAVWTVKRRVDGQSMNKLIYNFFACYYLLLIIFSLFKYKRTSFHLLTFSVMIPSFMKYNLLKL